MRLAQDVEHPELPRLGELVWALRSPNVLRPGVVIGASGPDFTIKFALEDFSAVLALVSILPFCCLSFPAEESPLLQHLLTISKSFEVLKP